MLQGFGWLPGNFAEGSAWRDLCNEPPDTIHTVPVVLTMMDGRITHDAR